MEFKFRAIVTREIKVILDHGSSIGMALSLNLKIRLQKNMNLMEKKINQNQIKGINYSKFLILT